MKPKDPYKIDDLAELLWGDNGYIDEWDAEEEFNRLVNESGNDSCYHSWKEYIGFHLDRFDYCEKCGIKRDEIDENL